MKYYNYDFDICAIITCMFLVFYLISSIGVKRRQNRIFLILAIDMLLSAVFDIFSAVTLAGGDAYPLALRYGLTAGYLITHMLACFLLSLYIIFYFDLHHRFGKRDLLLYCLPAIVDILMIAASYWTGAYFYIDEAGNYLYGPLVFFMYLIALSYLGLAFICIIVYRKALTISQFASMVILVIVSIGSAGIQRFFPTTLVEVFCQSMGSLGLLISTENESELYNSRTKVFNRFSFITHLEGTLVTRIKCGALLMKLPNMNYYSASLGVKGIYNVLSEITAWLRTTYPKATIYDCENGHFVLMLYREEMQRAEEIERGIFERFEADWQTNDVSIRFPVQLTYIRIPEQADESEQVMRMVDINYHTRDNRSEIVSAERFNVYRRTVEVEHAIDRAIRDRSFEVYYQPIIQTITGDIRSAEALIRLTDPYLGNVGPDEFIPIAEKNGAIIEIGNFVLDEVCRFYKREGLDELGVDYVEVNLSVLQCMDPGLTERFRKILEKNGVPASRINLEITESAAASNPALLKGLMKECEEMGFTFSLDDFGTGYSNLSTTMTLPFSIIKLDKSLLWEAENSRSARVIMTNMMRIFRELGMMILAEGIETIAQKKLLERLGCDYMQGYLYARPMPEKEFLAHLKRAQTTGNMLAINE